MDKHIELPEGIKILNRDNSIRQVQLADGTLLPLESIQVSDEFVQDIVADFITNSPHVGVNVLYDDANNHLIINTEGEIFTTALKERLETLRTNAENDDRYLQLVSEQDVTQHEDSLTITESQISDLNHFTPSTLHEDYGFTDNSANWDTAFGWGDHAEEGYLKTVPDHIHEEYIEQETDPTVPAHVKDIREVDIISWKDAFNWGDHAQEGYLKTIPDHTHLVSDITDLQTELDKKLEKAERYTDQEAIDAINNDEDHGSTANHNYVTDNKDILNGAGYITDYYVSEQDVKEHEESLTITEAQIIDLDHFVPTTLSADYGFTDNSDNWDTAYGWGNHASAGYLTSIPEHDHDQYIEEETDPTVPDIVKTITRQDIVNWTIAHGWGDHSREGYLKQLPEHSHSIDDIDNLQEELDKRVTGTENEGNVKKEYVDNADQFLQDQINQIVPPPDYRGPSTSLFNNIKVEKGESINNLTANINFNQRDAGAPTSFELSKEVGSQPKEIISNTQNNTVSFTNITEQIQVEGVAAYEEGPIKDNKLGNPDERGRIEAGSVSTRSYITPILNIFYGNTDITPLTTQQIRSLPNKVESNNREINLSTGTTNTIFILAIPASVTTDNTLQAQDTTNNVSLTYSFEEQTGLELASGAIEDYIIYEYEVDTPYPSNANHKITI